MKTYAYSTSERLNNRFWADVANCAFKLFKQSPKTTTGETQLPPMV